MKRKETHLLFFRIKLIVPVAFLTLIALGCSSGDKKVAGKTTATFMPFKLNTVILSKDQIQHWVDKGWTNPLDPIKKIFLQFASSDAANMDSLRLIAYPAKDFLSVYSEGREFTVIDTTQKQFGPTDTAYFANNYITIKKLNILDSYGKLLDFTFIKLIPKINKPKYGNYIVFDVQVVKDIQGIKTVLGIYSSDPCPHYCPDDTTPESEK
ncbi:MAG: hypothetical protein SGI96_19380 [Bacteroidota bacterium]|nr:hypothetical protein [Bacteroidota bacterium]